ncbi:unnamed protein product [Durusdinium trenchii]|uniref:Proteasome subunit alpha type-4-A n=2 Tax=Durusdinium trenchii TaxID=1381693 RepID=A0ABP0MGX5_9DINO
MEPDEEARKILKKAEDLLVLGKILEALEQAQIARDYYLESGDTALEAEAFRIEVLAKQDDGEYGAVNGEPTVKAPEIDLLCEIELARFQAAEHFKAEAVILYTLVEVNVTRPLHKMRGESQRWCEESQRIFNELGDTFWEGRAALMMVNVLHKFQQPKEMHRYAKQAYELFGVVGDRKRQGMSLHAKALACLNEKNTPGAVENALEALSIYRDIGDRRLEIAELKTIAIWRMTLEGKQGKIAAREAVEAVELSRKYPEPNQETVTLHVALQALLNIGERKQAKELASVSLKRFEKDPKLYLEVATLKVFLSQLEGDFSEKDMDLVEGIKSRKQKMHILIDLARSHVNHKKYNEAEPLVKEGLEMAREFKKVFREAQALSLMAEIQLAKGNHFEAMSFVKKSKKLYTKESDREGQVSAWLLLARCHLAAKNHEEAQSSCREAHALCEETKNYQQEIEVWQQVVELHMATSHHEAALQAAAKRLEVAQRNKASVKDQVEALDVICTLYLVMKNVPEAERSAAEMLRMAKLNESLIDLEIAALIQLVQVNILRLSESAGGAASAGKALQYAEQAWALASRDSAGLDYKSSAKYWHAEALIGAGRHPQALTAAREAEQFFKQMVVKDSGGLFRSILLQGRLERSLGKLEESKQSVERALSLATEAKNQAWQKMAREELDQLLRPPPTDDDDEGEPLFARAAGTAVAPRSGARSAGLDRNLIKGKLLEHVRSVLTEEGTVDAETPLLDMGLDSLSAMDLQNLIASSFPFSPPSTTILFDYPTVRELTEYLVDQSQEAGL